ncbi:MAG: FAD-binding oxidoreductase [Anaerolineae bacterium]|nr:FAD-binding oxidoreductase [Anaerolineae bacterium]
MQQKFLTNPAPNEMPTRADVVIIGGGPTGAAAAWAIERAAPGTRIVLLEQSAQLAAGASLASLENFRTCWAAPCLHRMMIRSRDVFFRADEYFGEGSNLGIKEQGYLFIAFNDDQAAVLKSDVEHLQRCGLSHMQYLNADEVGQRYPWLKGRVAAAKFDAHAGWLDSNALVYAFARATSSTTFLLDVKETRIRVEGGRVQGVTTSLGAIDAPQVVIAAGANARAVGRTAGIEIPIVVRPRQSFTTGWRHDDFAEEMPCIISGAPHPHVRPEARSGAIFGWEYRINSAKIDPENADGHDDALINPVWPVDTLRDPRFPSLTLSLLARQFGHKPGEGFGDPRYLRGIFHRAGYYVYRDNAYITTPKGRRQGYASQRAIIDAWPGIDGLFLTVAHVGHGIMSAPAAGEILASRLVGQPLPDPEFAAFGLDVPYVEHDSGGLSGSGLPGDE